MTWARSLRSALSAGVVQLEHVLDQLSNAGLKNVSPDHGTKGGGHVISTPNSILSRFSG
jgi:hypothetical protein